MGRGRGGRGGGGEGREETIIRERVKKVTYKASRHIEETSHQSAYAWAVTVAGK